jgi:hypothetical protein
MSKIVSTIIFFEQTADLDQATAQFSRVRSLTSLIYISAINFFAHVHKNEHYFVCKKA